MLFGAGKFVNSDANILPQSDDPAGSRCGRRGPFVILLLLLERGGTVFV